MYDVITSELKWLSSTKKLFKKIAILQMRRSLHLIVVINTIYFNLSSHQTIRQNMPILLSDKI